VIVIDAVATVVAPPGSAAETVSEYVPGSSSPAGNADDNETDAEGSSVTENAIGAGVRSGPAILIRTFSMLFDVFVTASRWVTV
jgi:hypothetical protein